MNIRDYIFINKAKSSNKIRILDILGFQADTNITQTPELFKALDNKSETVESYELLEPDININVNTVEETKYKINNDRKETSTETFEPIKITSQIKKIWLDIESRRKWVVPFMLILTTTILITSVTSIFITNRNKQIEINNLYINLTKESNELINKLPNIINVSTDEFYSKYDVSNSSAELQLVESTIMEYERNLINRDNFTINNELESNLNSIFNLINDLDNVISYRILNSEILIYDDLLDNFDEFNIDTLSSNLSEISAISKLNYDNLPKIKEFEKHIKLLDESLKSAEDLHGRLIAALRNNENEVAKSLIVAIKMNKEIERMSFIEALNNFKENKLIIYNLLIILP